MEAGAVNFKNGDWVAATDVRNPPFGKVKHVWNDEHGTALDIVMYAWGGECLGRVTPPEGGPTGFEPCCPAEHYAKIERPSFPLARDFTGNYTQSLKFL